MDQDQELDLLDLEDDANSVDALPEAAPFTVPRPKKPWLLMGLGVAIIILATWIIIAHVSSDSGTSVNIDLDAPVQKVEEIQQPVADLNVPSKPAEIAPKAEQKVAEPVKAAPVVEKTVETNGAPVRVVNDRKEVTFNPDKESKPVAKPVVKPAAKPAVKPATKPAPKAVSKPVATSNGSIYVQFGSYGTRAAAQAAEQKLRASHSSLFSGKQFVILAANVKGQTTYRLRVAFQNSNDANGFCRNAKSDGLDCYVTK